MNVRLILDFLFTGVCPGSCSPQCYPSCNPVCCYNSQQSSLYQQQQLQRQQQEQFYYHPPTETGLAAAAQYIKLPSAPAPAPAFALAPSPTPAPPKPPPPPPCASYCPKECYPDCATSCCEPKPPPMPLYLKRKQSIAVACEGHKLKIKCPNKYDNWLIKGRFRITLTASGKREIQVDNFSNKKNWVGWTLHEAAIFEGTRNITWQEEGTPLLTTESLSSDGLRRFFTRFILWIMWQNVLAVRGKLITGVHVQCWSPMIDFDGLLPSLNLKPRLY